MSSNYVVSRILDVYPRLTAGEVHARLAYGSFASVAGRFVYLEIPKAACSMMKELLRQLQSAPPLKLFVGPYRETRRDMFVHARENVPYPAITSLPESDQRDLLESEDVLRFTIVRNPYTRLVSAWRDKVILCEPSAENVYAAIRGDLPPLGKKDPVRFEEFVSFLEGGINEVWDAHWRRQVDLVFPQALSFTHIGKVECLSKTIDTLAYRIKGRGVPAIPRSHEASLHLPARYSADLAARVYSLYREDFTTFGYESGSWPRDSEELGEPAVALDRFIDELVERNLIIAHLYRERTELTMRYHKYRYSMSRLMQDLKRIVKLER
jgi:Sulfotransferase family